MLHRVTLSLAPVVIVAALFAQPSVAKTGHAWEAATGIAFPTDIAIELICVCEFEVRRGCAVLSKHDNYLDAKDAGLRVWLGPKPKGHDDESDHLEQGAMP